MNPNKRKSKIAGEICGLVVITGFLLHCFFVVTLGNRVKNQLSRIKSKGEFVTIADLKGPKIPDSENGAVIYKKAFSVLAQPARQHEKIHESILLHSQQSSVDWKKAIRSVEDNRNVMPLLEKAVRMPECRFPVDWEKGFDANLWHLDKLKQSAKLVAATAVLRARDGQTDEAVRLIDLTFKMNESLKDEPCLISQLARMRIIKVASSGLQQVLTHSNLSEEQCRSLDNTLSSIDTVPGYIKGLEGERVICFSMYDNLYRKIPTDPNNPNNKGVPKPVVVADGKFKTFMVASLRHYDEMQYLRFMNKLIDANRVNYRIAKSKKLFPVKADIPKIAMLTGMAALIYDFNSARDLPTVELGGSRIRLALTAYRNKFGAYPVSLSELRKGLDWKLPEDPFSGKDFIYKPKGNGFVLYSIGSNLKDDGGKIAGRKGSGDIVWEMNH